MLNLIFRQDTLRDLVFDFKSVMLKGNQGTFQMLVIHFIG